MQAATLSHRSVLLDEALAALRVRPAGRYVDATFGRGGHSAALLAALGPQGRLLALDRDPAAEHHAWAHFGADPRFSFVRSPFSRLAEQVRAWLPEGKVDGILLDLGVSSPQLDDPERGFSFTKDGPLDMRMDPAGGPSAAEWLATATEAEIDRVLKELGEERFHRRVARAIVEARRQAPLTRTLQLAQIVAAAVPSREPGKHPATRTFQAVRIYLNRELEELAAALEQAVELLVPGGRVVVISFHSLEDRLVKRFLRRQAQGVELPPDLPVPECERGATLRLVGKAIRPGAAEVAANPRARSAVLRAAERLP
ncbi:MAG TPA: 16S rRNA (cytosine(1402)-N(4))-methyltransferase RsmH [Candidatus Competibacteraceae bacterium]|nr:16S rRNA (cytosine(1402)-N(4))-methyltransferase RsmH [Candidatus Competibacteraceae bacterium]